jgi:hypothetical protein
MHSTNKLHKHSSRYYYLENNPDWYLELNKTIQYGDWDDDDDDDDDSF